MVNATLANIAHNPTNKGENPRVPVIITANDFSTLYAPLVQDGRMEKYYWAPTREDRIGVSLGIFRNDNVSQEDVVKLVDSFPDQSIDFFGALRARVYDNEVMKWVEELEKTKMMKSLEGPGPHVIEKSKMTIEKLLEYGYMLVQENVKDAALGLGDAINRGSFHGKAALH